MTNLTGWNPTLEDQIRGMDGIDLALFIYKEQTDAVKRGSAESKKTIYDRLKEEQFNAED